MTIASCFFYAPTPNALISKSNITWRPHLVSSPVLSLRLSSSPKSISLHRNVSIFSATIDNGGDGGGGSGDGGKNNGDGEGGEDRERNRNEAIMLLAESGTGLESLPKDLAAATESGRIPGSVITRFLDLQRSAVMRWLMQFAGIRERLLADELFLAKLAMECGVGVFIKAAAENERCRDNFFNELEVVLVMAIMLVYLSAPTVSLRPPRALTAGGISKFFHSCPDNAFQIAISGTSYTLLQRLGAIVRNGAKLFAVGTTISLVGNAVTNALKKTRRAVYGTCEDEIKSVPILSTSVAYGVYMAVS